ncbi:vWA domain-containing protein [Algicella marina]|uniref:VWA domain-containing protein n=1 Tax=Algicella marina TaxID=2683284 RepID=A0A6P1T427_9RHOB|nr:VWA domain-containing protein [Algicella marina]QHQ36511.1 VWA domain-containing protein [Algicella marina]
MTLAVFSLLRPFWLLAIVAIAILAVRLYRRRNRIGDWESVIDPDLMAAMRALGRVETSPRHSANHLPLLAAALTALALTGPALERRDALSFRNLDGVIFVMDVSPSMTGSALWPATVTMGRVGVNALSTKPGALIVYAGDAYLAAPLTADTRNLGFTMTLLNDETVPDTGTRPALGLSRAAELLREARILAGDVVLMTDGAGLGPEALAQAAEIADIGGRLSVVYAPTERARETGEMRAQAETLASLGGGRLYELNEANALAADLSNDATSRLEQQSYQLLVWRDFGRYLLLLALLPALGFFRRQSA